MEYQGILAHRRLEHCDVVHHLPSQRRLILHQKVHDNILAIHMKMKESIPFGLALPSAKGPNSIQPHHLVDMRHRRMELVPRTSLEHDSKGRAYDPPISDLALIHADAHVKAAGSHAKAEHCALLEA